MSATPTDQAALDLSCMDCCKDCDTFEVLDNSDGETDSQLWCYCEDCDTQTFRDLPNE